MPDATSSAIRTRDRGSYRELTRTRAASFVFVAPLVVFYHIGILVYPEARNGAQPIFDQLFSRVSHLGPAFFSFLMLGLLCLAIWLTRKRQPHRPGLYALMLLESCGWAALMLLAAHLLPLENLNILAQQPPPPPNGSEEFLKSFEALLPDLVASAGAGVYEEVLFRLLLMGGLILLLHRYLGGHSSWVVPLAAIASALIFSYAHHGIGGEVWNTRIFWIRAAMGGLLGGIFWFRGLGIVVYTHTLYNVVLAVVNHF